MSRGTKPWESDLQVVSRSLVQIQPGTLEMTIKPDYYFRARSSVRTSVPTMIFVLVFEIVAILLVNVSHL